MPMVPESGQSRTVRSPGFRVRPRDRRMRTFKCSVPSRHALSPQLPPRTLMARSDCFVIRKPDASEFDHVAAMLE